ncbi:MAG TPA: FMN-binding protein [Clostridia bacterium]|nr:FMN-binding protein [Clostridia bacterium]
MKRKGKFKMILTVIAVSVVLLGLGMVGGMLYTAEEHKEAKNLPIAAIDFKNLNDGMYIGEYEGGMKKWRTNKVQVTVSSDKVTEIKVLEQNYDLKPEFTDKLYDRVIGSQSLQVDTISGATLTSKACLKSVENALIKAQKR